MGWDVIKSNLLVLVGAFVGLALLAGIAAFLWNIGSGTASSEIVLPIVILASVIALLIVLGLLTLLLSLLGLGTPGEALGLPSGSVRAVIALMLFVVFAIIAIYLFGIVIKNDKAAGIDLAKQLIVLIGTLVTAVASFYFGSNSSTAATKAALAQTQAGGGGPNATQLSPPALKADDTAQELTISGTNLGKVAHVKLTQGDTLQLLADAATIKPKNTEVKCSVVIPNDSSKGLWSVVVSDNADNSSRVKDAVTIQ
jgi:hypothetical protein